MPINIKPFLIFACLPILAACGGGSDSSGAGGSSGPDAAVTTADNESQQPAAPVARTFSGTVEVTLTADGFPPVSGSSDLVIIVDGSRVTLTVDGESVRTTLDGDSFSASIPITESDDGITCTGAADIAGTVRGDNASGDISGSGNCTGDGVDIPVTLSGSISASR